MSIQHPDPDSQRPAAPSGERPVPGSSADDPVQSLVFQGLELLEAGRERALDALLEEHPLEASAVRARIASLQRAGLIAGGSAAPPERLGDFRLLEPLGGGGMGVVYRAWQESLDREVALKLIRPEQHWFPGARERFQREVEAVARLHHPGIVPVFTVGEEEGIPFLAMERVRGCTLADAIGVLEEREPATLTGQDLERAVASCAGVEPAPDGGLAPIFRGTWTEVALRVVREVAEALEHAHRLGVLHRDLKPSNVMMTPEGRVMLVDFGLSAVEGADRMTRTGATVGSLPYVPPEILAQETLEYGRRGDVYELGVTLYELLGLVLPFASSNPVELVQRVIEAAPTPVRRLNPAVTLEAATVCGVAMERDPARRYASAEALARDLTNALEHRPIAARPTPLARRARRWVERHPGGALALVLGVLLVTVAPSLLAWQSWRSAQRLAVENGRSRAFLGKTLEAIEDMLVTVAASDIKDVPHLEQKRRLLLERALGIYEELSELTSPEGGSQVLIADGHSRALVVLGQIQRELGRLDESRASLKEVLELRRLEPDSPTRRFAAAHATHQLAKMESAQGTPEAVMEYCALGRSFLGSESDPKSTQVRQELGHMNAQALYQSGDASGAIEALTQILEETDELLAADPLDAVARERAAALSVTLGGIAFQTGDFERADVALERAVSELELQLERGLSPVGTREELVRALLNRGQLMRNQGRHEPAMACFERAIELQEDLARSFPGVPARQLELVNAQLACGLACDMQDETRARGRALLEEARTRLALLLDASPADVDRISTMGMVLAGLGTLRMHQGLEARAAGDEQAAITHLAAAHEAYPEAIEWQERARELQPDDPEIGRALRRAELGRADVWLAEGHHAEAMDAVLRAGEIGREDWRDLRMLAGRALLAGEFAEVDEELDPEDREYLAGACRDEGLALLERAVDAGYADLDDLEEAERLSSLRARPEFEDLRARVMSAAGTASE